MKWKICEECKKKYEGPCETDYLCTIIRKEAEIVIARLRKRGRS